MGKIAAMTLLNREDSTLSPHFGKAKWIMIRDTESGALHFVQNHGLNGKNVVEQLLREGCSDVICGGIGAGAVEILKRARIRGWLAAAAVPAPRLFEMLKAGLLQPVSATSEHGEGCGHHDHGHAHSGCGCQHRTGEGHSGGCCGA